MLFYGNLWTVPFLIVQSGNSTSTHDCYEKCHAATSVTDGSHGGILVLVLLLTEIGIGDMLKCHKCITNYTYSRYENLGSFIVNPRTSGKAQGGFSKRW